MRAQDETIGDVIRKARGLLGWSVADLAKRAQIDHESIRKYELGESTPRSARRRRLSEQLGVDLFDNSTYLSIGQCVRFRRQALGMRQIDLAMKVGCAQSFISKIESGRGTSKRRLMRKICDALGLENLGPRVRQRITIERERAERRNPQHFGEAIRLERLRLNWTQPELADRSGVCTNTISKIERGVRHCSIFVAKCICEALCAPSHVRLRWVKRELARRGQRLDRGFLSRRLALMMTLSDVARESGLSAESVSNVERGLVSEHCRSIQIVEAAISRAESVSEM